VLVAIWYAGLTAVSLGRGFGPVRGSIVMCGYLAFVGVLTRRARVSAEPLTAG
jgi:hypothetical protein